MFVLIRRDPPARGRVQYHLDVQDTGIGISEDAQKRIFEPFEQAGPQTRNGSGLGLAIVKNLLLLMGGTICVESAPGHGSSFHIDVPFAESKVQSLQKKSEEGEIFDFSGQSVLIVEDHPINMEIARKLMEKSTVGSPLSATGRRPSIYFCTESPANFRRC